MVSFLVVFIVCIIGFGIYFEGLYGNLDGSIYNTEYKTFLSLFSAAMGNYDFNSFEDSYYVTIGSLVLMIYSTFTLVILVNLLIARMSSAHDTINERSQEEWSFIQV